MMSALLIASEGTEADPADVYADTVQELSDAMINASEDTNIFLTEDFADDLELNGTIQIILPSTHDYNITICGGTALTAKTGERHFDIVNNGTGTIRFEDVKLTNDSKVPNTGGMQLQGGNYEFANCSFTDLTRTSVTFNGNRNDASFVDCTFSDNVNRAIVLRGGQSADVAEYDLRNCLFLKNSVTGSTNSDEGGAAIHAKGSYFSLSIDDCAFIENRSVGTMQAISSAGANKRMDGGALYINAADGNTGALLNIHNSYFEKNFAQDDGGAILVEGTQTFTSIRSSISNCTFYDNTVAGAHYGGSMFGLTAAVTDGAGGAINYFGLTESEVTHCTFYNNGVTGAYPAGVNPTLKYGSTGGGGAIAVDTGNYGTDIEHLPPMPKLTNNIFVGNYVLYPASQSNINTINGLSGNVLGDMLERSRTGNVFVLPLCDADFQGVLLGMDPRMLENNGNIGYDNGNHDTYGNPKTNHYYHTTGSSGYSNGISSTEGILVKNIFAHYNGTANRGDPNTAISTEYGDYVGAEGSVTKKKCFIVSPTSNELYRDGSVPYVVEIPYDALGNKRDTFPNAGAVEIFWTMFNPGAGADWTDAVPTEIENPDNSGEVYEVIQSLNFGTNNSYYVMTAVGIPDVPSGDLIAMPRSAIEHSSPDYGFLGWRSSVPDLDWIGYAQWAADNGYVEISVQEFLGSHPLTDLPADAFPLYQPGDIIHSAKQTLTAEWQQDLYRVDFDLNYDAVPNWYNSPEPGKEAPRLNVAAGSTIAAPVEPQRTDHAFGGWHTDAGCSQVWDFDSDAVTADIVLYAKWAILTYSVIYHSDGAGSGAAPADPGSPYAIWSQVTVLGKGTLNRTNFTFEGWSTVPGDSSAVYAEGDTFVISGDVDLYPVWTYVPGGGTAPATFYIYSSADDGSYIDPLGTVSVKEGGSAAFTFSARQGYDIKAVFIDGEERPELPGAGSYTFNNVIRDHYISVISAAPETVVPEDMEGGGKWSPLNLICAVIALAAGAIGIVAGRNRSVEDEKTRRSRSAAALRVLGLLTGIMAIVVFFLTEDWTLPPSAVDEWTLLMFVLLVASIFATLVSFRFDRAGEE